jgi:small subunit ribosomal protein S17
MPKRKLKGKIVSDRMDKTDVVEVKRMVYHSKYKRRYFISKKYKVHDGKNEYKIGDEVIIEETSPLSKDKKWQILSKVTKNK